MPLPEIQIFGGGAHAQRTHRPAGHHGTAGRRAGLVHRARLVRARVSIGRCTCLPNSGTSARSGRRRRVLAGRDRQRGGARADVARRSNGPDSDPATTSPFRSTSLPTSSIRGDRYELNADAATCTPAEWIELLTQWTRRYAVRARRRSVRRRRSRALRGFPGGGSGVRIVRRRSRRHRTRRGSLRPRAKARSMPR